MDQVLWLKNAHVLWCQDFLEMTEELSKTQQVLPVKAKNNHLISLTIHIQFDRHVTRVIFLWAVSLINTNFATKIQSQIL